MQGSGISIVFDQDHMLDAVSSQIWARGRRPEFQTYLSRHGEQYEVTMTLIQLMVGMIVGCSVLSRIYRSL